MAKVEERHRKAARLAWEDVTNVGCFDEEVDVIAALLADQEAELADWLERRAGDYPEDIWTPPPPGEHGKTVDGCSAAALRLMAPKWAQWVRSGEWRGK